MIKLITILMVLLTISSYCEEGCLRCDIKKNKCLFCDISNGFRTLRGKCVKLKTRNCAFFDLDGNCAKCREGQILDPYTDKCIPIRKAGMVENCSEYSSENICGKCSENFSLTFRNTCIEVTAEIENCELYKSVDTCGRCKETYILSIDHKICEKLPEIENCEKFTPIRCLSCQPGYQENSNNYLYILLRFSNKFNNDLLQKRFKKDFGKFQNLHYQRFNTCQSQMIPNCLVHSTFDECITCSPGYFVNKGTCQVYPKERILNCVKYQSLEVCTQCEQGRYLEAPNLCTLVTPAVASCKSYNASATQPSCSECIEGFYLSEPNICSKRGEESKIENCELFYINLERCQKCKPTFVRTQDFKKCLPELSNCQIYAGNNVETVELVCETCVEGYYYDLTDKKCVQGGIEYCLEYSKNANLCKTCINRYYVESGGCVAHEDLVYCDQYSKTVKNSCEVCNNNTQWFERMNTCLPVVPIDNCKTYGSTTECLFCEDGYTLTNDKKCSLIPGNEFCLQKNNNMCIKCLKNYILEAGQCRDPLLHIIRNCESHTVNGLNDYSQLKCNYCRKDTIPINFKESYVCTEKEYMKNQLNFEPNKDCLQYKANGNTYECNKCVEGKVLKDGVCSYFCSNTQTQRTLVVQYHDSTGDGNFDSMYVEKKNVCDVAINSCEISAPDLLQNFNEMKYSCIVCSSNTISEVKFDDSRVIVPKPEVSSNLKLRDPKSMFQFTPMTTQPSRTCIQIVNIQIFGDLDDVNKAVKNCDLYYDLQIAFGCLKCNHGYTGKVVSVINECSIYLNLTTCKECNQGYYLQKPYLCSRVQPVLNCLEYKTNAEGTCSLCKSDYYVQTVNNEIICKKRENLKKNCQNHQPDSLECLNCKSNNFLHAGECYPKIYNCLDHDLIGLLEFITCLKCKNTYFLQQNKCVAGDVPQCLVYDQLKFNECKVCNPGLYLNQDKMCIPNLLIQNCSVKDPKFAHCKECSPNHFMFWETKICTAVTQITDCVEYVDLNICKKCIASKYPTNYGVSCRTIPNEWNCDEWGDLLTSDHCIRCQADHVLYKGKCYNWFQNQMSFCDTNLTFQDRTKDFKKCEYCQSDKEAVDIRTIGFCLEQSFIDILKPIAQYKMPSKCLKYKYDQAGNIINCVKCNFDYYLKIVEPGQQQPNYTVCVDLDTCRNSPSYYPSYASIEIDNNNQVSVSKGYACIKLEQNIDYPNLSKFNNCILSPALNVDKVLYGCATCLDNHVSIINMISSFNEAKVTSFDQRSSSTSVLNTKPIIDECLNPLTIDIRGGNKDNYNRVKNCKYYYLVVIIATKNVYGCLSCIGGKTGIIVTPEGLPVITSGYLSTCEVDITDCLTLNSPDIYRHRHKDQYASHFDLQVLFSCIKCDNSKFPIAWISGIAPYVKLESLLPHQDGVTTAVASASDQTGFGTECVVPTASKTGVTSTVTANCALFIGNTSDLSLLSGDSTAEPYPLNSVGIICVACLGSYRASKVAYGSETNNVPGDYFAEAITECTLIANCNFLSSSETFFNGCEYCLSGFNYQYENDMIKYDTCIVQTVDNCYASTTTQECKQCIENHVLRDGKCISIIIGDNSNALKEPVGHKKDMRSIMKQTQIDSIYCNGSYMINHNELFSEISQTIQPINKQCSTLIPPTETPASPLYTQCTEANNLFTNYRYNITKDPVRLDCVICDTFIRADDGKCADIAFHNNCQLAQSETANFCKVCDEGYISVAGVCKQFSVNNFQLRPVPYCVDFDDSAFATGAVCKKCMDTKVMKKTDIQGKIEYECLDPTLEQAKSNCAQYNAENPDRVYCIECLKDFALVIFKGDIVNNNPGYARTCLSLTNHDSNCATYDPTDMITGKLTCTKCVDDTFKVLNRVNEPRNICVPIPNVAQCKTYDLDTTLAVANPNNNLPSLSNFQCIECNDDYFLEQDLDTASYKCTIRTRNNVLTYSQKCLKFEIGADYCKDCISNHFLNVEKTLCESAIDNVKEGNLLSCVEMKECRKDRRYDGLHHHLESVLSCHECKDPEQIPFVAIAGGKSFDTIKGIAEYEMSDSGNTFDVQKNGNSNFCAKPEASSFLIQIINFTFPIDCAIGVLNANSIPDASDSTKNVVDRTKIAVFCGACKPGYKATYAKDGSNVDVKFMIASCTEIQNCEQSTSFNYCTSCKKGFTFNFEGGKVKFDQCISVTNNPNCFAYDLANSRCKFCYKGTYLNQDGYCEKIEPVRCEFNHFMFKNVYDMPNFAVGLYLNKEGTGCTKCQDDFVGIYMPNDYWMCTESEVHAANTLPQGTLYISKCENYFVLNNTLKCQKCATGFIPIESTGICTSNGQLQNCILAQDAQFCLKCDTGFNLVNRKCVAANVEHCVDYLYNIDLQEQRCKKCAAGYYLEANKCLPGIVENCLFFETITVCNQCKPGYHNVFRNQGTSYCFPIDKRLNCKTFNKDEFQKGRLACDECVNNLFIIDTDPNKFYKTHCKKFFEIANCLLYNIKPQIGDSEFTCQKCSTNFFIQDNTCVMRKNKLDNCMMYSDVEDKCVQCKEGYFVSTDGSDCEIYPIGVPGCNLYKDSTTCERCITNKYLKDNLCIDVVEDKRVDSCLYYAAESICDQCVATHMMEGGKCIQINATGCKTYDSVSACSSCPDNFGFKEESGVKSCEVTNISNCVINEDEIPYKCVQCDEKNYVKDGICVQIATEISGCLIYESESTCKKCEATSALSLDKKTCINTRNVYNNLDEFCTESQILEIPVCNACKAGFYFKDGKCAECEYEGEGCAQCDPRDAKRCLICRPGYYMDIKEQCLKVVIPQPPTEPTDGGDGEGTDGKASSVISQIFATSLLMILALFNQ